VIAISVGFRCRAASRAASLSSRLPAMFVATCLLLAAGAHGAEIAWFTIDAGGTQSAVSGNWRLVGTVGQPDATLEMTGGGFELVGGYWALPSVGCAGDINLDGFVNLTDLSILLSNFGIGSGATPGDGDIDADGDVDLTDLSRLLAVFGTNCN